MGEKGCGGRREVGRGGCQMDRPKALTMQYMVLFSHRTVQLPSVELSQKHELAVCRPAPFFCMITQVTKEKQTFIRGIYLATHSSLSSYVY